MNLNILTFENLPILEQLKLEEALLRTDERNWCIINKGSPAAIVMGLSSNPSDLICQEKVEKNPIPIIQRFSGGGTVIVDEDTLFVSFIFQSKEHPIDPYPKPILEWTAALYQEALQLPSFGLSENDYTLGSQKVGGNAQYLRSTRWLHHTTFLWDYSSEQMNYLKMPSRQPKYREKRNHDQFLTTLKPYLAKETFQERLLNHLENKFTLVHTPILHPFPFHRQTTSLINNFTK